MAFVNWFAEWSLDSSSRYPGYTWGGVEYLESQYVEDEDNLELSGAIIQGVDWYSFGAVTVNTFVKFEYTFDTEDHWISNNVTYGIGSKLKIPVRDKIGVQIGFLFNQNKRLESGQTENRVSTFLSWYF